MVLFSQAERNRLREKCKKDPRVLQELHSACAPVATQGPRIPQTGIATWGHYFACPNDAARFEYSYTSDHDFRCPCCGKRYSGEPYLGAWWRITNGVNCTVSYYAALLWLLSEETEYLDLSLRILNGYADHYSDYQEHGDIPYNRQGRMNSQIICDSECMGDLGKAYDIIKGKISAGERAHIENDLLIPGAELLKKNRTDQLHNHEVIVNAALGILGLALDREDYIDFALYSPYGLIYQLEHGVLEDGMWFESTFGYHYYALIAFMKYEKMACSTKYSLLNRPEYRRMYLFPLKLLQADYSLPRLGDSGSETMFRQLAWHYEFLYCVYGDREFAGILHKIYERCPRGGLEVFLYGSDEVKNASLELKDYHNGEGSGLTVLRGSGRKQYLLFRHGRYGGEHDHYDRLSLHYTVGDKEVMPDLGTVAYGAPPHYGYFKNTFTHNTVCINGQNQPPCNGHTVRYEQQGNATLVECFADWRDPGQLPDSFVIRQWDESAYCNVRMDRTVLFTDDYFLEAFRVRGASGRRADWIIHPKGHCPQADTVHGKAALPDCEPAKYFQNVRGYGSADGAVSTWESAAGCFSVYSRCLVPAGVIYAEAPDNPMDGSLTYLIRSVDNAPEDLVFAAVFRLSDRKADMTDVDIALSGGKVSVRFTLNGERKEHDFTVGEA